MRAIAAIVRWDQQEIQPELVHLMADAMAHRARGKRRTFNAPGVSIASVSSQGEVPCPASTLDERGRTIVVADARIDERDGLCNTLDSIDCCDEDLLAAALDRWADQASRHILGDYAWIGWQPQSSTLTLSRDFCGMRPLYWARGDGFIAVASEMDAILALDGIEREPDLQYLADWRCGLTVDKERTFVKGIRKVPAAHALVLEEASTRLVPYWRPTDFPEDTSMQEGEAIDRVREIFREAVRVRIQDVPPLQRATLLSGGLDSSSVACMALQVGEKPSLCYSMEFTDSQADERTYQAHVARLPGIQHVGVPSDGFGPYHALSEWIRAVGGPYVGPHANHVDGLLRKASKDGVRVLLDGLDGDGVIGSGRRYHMELLRQGQPRRALAFFKEAFPNTRWPLVTLSRQVIGEFLVPVRAFFKAAAGRESVRGGALPVSARIPQWRRLRRQFPLAFRAARSERESRCFSVEPALQDTSGSPLSLAAARFGIERRSPFLDRRLVEYCLTVPGHLLYRQGLNRWYFRQAMAGILPEAIRLRGSKGQFAPLVSRGLEETPALPGAPGTIRRRLGLTNLANPYVRYRVAQLEAALAWLSNSRRPRNKQP